MRVCRSGAHDPHFPAPLEADAGRANARPLTFCAALRARRTPLLSSFNELPRSFRSAGRSAAWDALAIDSPHRWRKETRHDKQAS
jgi:hypothetical protein